MESNSYLKILKAIKEIPFGIGRKTLIDLLQGNAKNPSIKRNKLYLSQNFGCLNLKTGELNSLIDTLLTNRMIEIKQMENSFIKTIKITSLGEHELKNPSLLNKKLDKNKLPKETAITSEEKILFKKFDFFLEKFNEQQKKAITSDSSEILCIAGAGSGKTTSLTKRIEFLVKYKKVQPEKILAITFTRKAKEELKERLTKLKVENVNIETFNSFCEKVLKKYNNLIYKKPTRMLNYGDKVIMLMSALNHLNLKSNELIDIYFSPQKKNNKTKEELFNIFMKDCFSVLNYLKIKNKPLESLRDIPEKNEKLPEILYKICSYLQNYMRIYGLRDYDDQILDTLAFFKNNKELIPHFRHILVDEYQDVNALQIELLDLLNPENIFCVGDPRQSIFGWRGSDISYILNFEKKYQNPEIIYLTKNYRSSNHIVNFINLSIKEMNLPDLEPVFTSNKEIFLSNFPSEEKEAEFIAKKILSSNLNREEIFVLARTNKQLETFSKLMKNFKIPHVLKTDEINNPVFEKKGEVILATIHSIKGLEADMVFIIGCNEQNFPCRTSDNPILEFTRLNDYDKEGEEKRLFYVALSRARKILHLTYSGKNPTSFINKEMAEIITKI